MNIDSHQTKTWFVYLLRCQDGTLYTGITNDLNHRLATHNAGLGAKYTQGRRPVELLAYLAQTNRSSALKIELLVKKLPKMKKILYFESQSTQKIIK